MIARDITTTAQHLWEHYPILTVTGPRQSGKTTLVRHAFAHADYVNLEYPDIRAAIQADPRGFLSRHRPPLIFDEIQHLPVLLSYLQAQVDASGKPGQYILTGSHQPSLQAAVSQSLAGRTGILELLPFSLHELARAGIRKQRDQWLLDGFLPRLYDDGPGPTMLYRDYFRTYVERDVRQLANLRRTTAFETFVRLLAGRIGQLFNAESMANDAGISASTIREWLALLEASYVIFPLHPYYRNFGRRFVKTRKYYFVEPGLAAYLLGLRTPRQVALHPLMGNLFENLVIAELRKARLNAGLEPDMYFLRTSNGVEVDLAIEQGPALDFYEIKAGETFHPDMAANLRKLRALLAVEGRSAVIYSGHPASFADGIPVLDYAALPPFSRTGDSAATTGNSGISS